MDSISKEDKQNYDTLLASFVYSTGVAFRVVSSKSFEDFVTAICPAYEKVIAAK